MKHLLIAGMAFLSGLPTLYAQSEDCPMFTTSKSEKALEKAQDTDKYSIEKRIELLRDALDADGSCYACAQELAHLLFNLYKRGAPTGEEAESVLSDLLEDCPEFHAEPWYEWGALAYGRGEAELAAERFERFLAFSADGNLGKRYDRQAEEVRVVLDELAFELAFHAFENQMIISPIRGVNSAADEYLPSLSPDGSLLFLTHAERVKSKGDVVSRLIERFQWSHRSPAEVDFGSPEDLPSPFNDGSHYGGASISVDNRELFIAASNPTPDNPDNIDLFQVKYEVVGRSGHHSFLYEWGELLALPTSVNSTDGWEAQPALAADGQELFFAAVKATSIPDEAGNPTMDLMVSHRSESGIWSEAVPLTELNTAANEKSPFLHPDGKTLYFSSDRNPGGGGYDIWYSRRDDNGNWGAPVNVGSPLNTSGDEHGLVVAADGRQAYLGSRRQGTEGLDILGLLLPPPHRAAEVTIVRGSVLDELGQPDPTARVGLLNTETLEREWLDVNADDGTFARALELDEAEPMVLFTEGERVAFDAVRVPVPSAIDSPATAPVIQLRAAPIAVGAAYEMRDITYATSSALIDSDSKVLLTAFADYLKRHPELEVVIHGHTDNLGAESTNLTLSRNRAEAVMAYLVEAGVDANRLDAVGFGSKQPKASNDTEAGRAANRRTEFVIKK